MKEGCREWGRAREHLQAVSSMSARESEWEGNPAGGCTGLAGKAIDH